MRLLRYLLHLLLHAISLCTSLLKTVMQPLTGIGLHHDVFLRISFLPRIFRSPPNGVTSSLNVQQKLLRPPLRCLSLLTTRVVLPYAGAWKTGVQRALIALMTPIFFLSGLFHNAYSLPTISRPSPTQTGQALFARVDDLDRTPPPDNYIGTYSRFAPIVSPFPR